MNIRTFHGKNLIEVMNRVHQELGTTPIILDSRSDQKGLTITAAKHNQATSSYHFEDGSDEEWQPRQASRQPRIVRYQEDPSQNASSPTLREHSIKQFERHLQACLFYHNVDKILAKKILACCSYHPEDSIVDVLADALSQVFTLKPLQTTSSETQRMMLVGIPGVGKSTLAAKLAMAALVRGGNVHLITIDTLKTGATYQLEAYARALRAHFSICASPGELRETLRNLSPDAHVIIDTPGINPKNQEDIRRLVEFVCVTSIRPTLVIGAGEDPSVTNAYTKHFTNLGASHLIATRCDLVDRLGNILTALCYGPYTLTALSFSPYIATPLQLPRSVVLAKHLLTAAGVFSIEDTGDEALEEIILKHPFRQAS